MLNKLSNTKLLVHLHRCDVITKNRFDSGLRFCRATVYTTNIMYNAYLTYQNTTKI